MRIKRLQSVLFILMFLTLSSVYAQKSKVNNSKVTGEYTITNPCQGTNANVLESYNLPQTISLTTKGKNKVIVKAGYHHMEYTYNTNKIAGGSVTQLTFESYDEESGKYQGGGSIMISEEGIELHWLQGEDQECMTIYNKTK
ncbi:MAG: hypothetical protein ACK5IF_06865 [Ignavibacteria bacterium]|jgi:hypothetical protein